jgi:hypothetical protein
MIMRENNEGRRNKIRDCLTQEHVFYLKVEENEFGVRFWKMGGSNREEKKKPVYVFFFN